MSFWNRPTRIVCAACKGAFNFFSGDWVKEGDRYRSHAVCPHCNRVFDLFCTFEELMQPGEDVRKPAGWQPPDLPAPWWKRIFRKG